MPSPWAALTSAPCLINERTVAVSPRISASAIEASTRYRGAAAAETSVATTTSAMRFMALGRLRMERERIRAVSEGFHIVHTEHVHDAQHRVGHWGSVERLEVQVAGELAVRATEQNERAASMVVKVIISAGRSVHDERFIKQRMLALGDALQLVEEVGKHADVILVDQEKSDDPFLGAGVV